VNYAFSALYGKWSDSAKSSWHQDYNLYLAADPVKLSDTLALKLGTGFRHVRESYDGSRNNIFRYDASLEKKWSPRLTTLAGYHYITDNRTLFDYNRDELGRQFDLGFMYKIDRMNSIGYLQTYDVANNRIYDQDVTWYRNLHCWEAKITYRIKRSELRVRLAIARF